MRLGDKEAGSVSGISISTHLAASFKSKRSEVIDNDVISLILHIEIRNRQNRLTFVYTHFKSCGQSLDKTSFDFSNKYHAM